jgi:stage II sporulation protein AB (anti-sigma F factor)
MRPYPRSAQPTEVRTPLDASVGARPISELQLPAVADELFTARTYAAQAAAAFGLGAEDCYDFAYAVNEAVTNAIRHGAPDEQGRILLSVVADGDRLTFVVRDYGTFRPPAHEHNTVADHGRGLALMRSLTDEIRLCVEPGGTSVHLSKARVHR